MRFILLACLLPTLFVTTDIRAEGCSSNDVSCWQEKAEDGDSCFIITQ